MIFLLGPLLIIWLICGIWLVSWCGIYYRRKTGKLWRGLGASVLVFLLYFGHEFYAYSKWKVMCSIGTDLHIYKVQAVKGFGVEQMYARGAELYFKEGYEFVDGKDWSSTGWDLYIFKMELGRVTQSKISQRKSEFLYRLTTDNSSLLNKQNSSVIRLVDGFKMGELNSYGYKSGYVIQLLKMLVGVDAVQERSAWCDQAVVDNDLIFSVIPPTQ